MQRTLVHRATRALAIAFPLLALPGCARAQSARPALAPVDSAVVRAVEAVDARLTAAESSRDSAGMAAVFAPDYLAVAPDGEMLSARARIFRMTSGMRAKDSTVNLTAPWVRQVAPGVVLVTRSHQLWGVSGGAPLRGLTVRVTRLYVQRDGQWLLLFQQGTPLADEHVAGTGRGAPAH